MASQQQTYTTNMTVTAAMLNAEFGELYSNLSNSNISASAAIALSKLASDAWTTYVPTFSETIGNGVISGRYIKVGRLVIANINLVWGSTTSIASAPTFTLPFTVSSSAVQSLADVLLVDTGTNTFYGKVQINASATTTDALFYQNSGTAFLSRGATASTLPFTWTTNDIMCIGPIVYEASS